jgi:plasmid stability protein
LSFTNRMDEDLRGFFSGAHLADYGLKSWMSSYLERAEAAADSDYTQPVRWDGHSEPPPQTIACKPSQGGRSYEMTELPERAYDAVKRELRIRAAFGLMTPTEVRTLAAYYVPKPRWAPEGLATLGEFRSVVALMVGLNEARRIVASAALSVAAVPREDKAATKVERSIAKTRLTAAIHAAKKAVHGAQDSYANAIGINGRAERTEKTKRYKRGIL